MAEKRGLYPPDFDWRRGATGTEIVHYFRVRPHRRKGIKMAGTKYA
jgi:hypothetical protein